MMMTSLKDRRSKRLDRAFRNEELAGLKLATQVRIAALTAVAVSFLLLQSSDIKYVNIGALATFAAIGYANYRIAVARGGQDFIGYLFFALDVVLLTVLLLVINPAASVDGLPPPMMLRLGNFVFYYLFVAFAALSYAPGLMLWAGLTSALAWGFGCLYVANLPDTVNISDLPPPSGGWNNETLFVLLANPNFFAPFLWQGEIISILIVSSILAVVVWRSRRLVVHQAVVERERANLSRYFPPSMVDQLAASDTPFDNERRQNVTVLFADIVGFTALSENMTPESTINLLRNFHALLEQSVFENSGTLDKYLGDGLMATFGTPTPGEQDAVNGIKCALAMLKSIREWNVERVRDGEQAIRLSIGLHSGEAVLGDIGSERRLEFAVLGDVVNVTSRIETLTRQLDAALLVSDAVVSAVKKSQGSASATLIDFERLPEQALRGRAQPITLWRLLSNS
jgi:adenylate cyclase